MNIMGKSHDIEIDAMHTLENFCDAYDDEASIVVLEAIANSLDAKADRIEITFGDKNITFTDNGPGMNYKQFKAYHKISGSVKIKGSGIGFAGVGAKIYLAIWKNTNIHTETYGNDGPLASDMHVNHRRLKWEECDTSTSMRTRGTSYSVKLREKDYNILQSKLSNIILDVFNPSMINGLTIIINGDKLEPWNPPHVFQTRGIVKSKKRSFPIILSIMEKDIPKKYRHIQYQVYGKNVTIKKPEWISDVLEPHKNRVYAMVDATGCSEYLKLNKNSFKSGQSSVSNMYKNVERWMHVTLRCAGYIEKYTGDSQRNPKMTEFFQNLFQNPEYKWLNPNTTNRIKSGKSKSSDKNIDSKIETIDPTEIIEKSDEKKSNENKKHGGSRLNISLVDRYDVPWDGILDPETNNFHCNKQHPLYHKYEKNEQARNQHVKSVLFNELIKNGAKQNKLTVEQAFKIHRDLMTEAKDLKVV